MPHPADLFELIHSLTPSEKRYFKVHAEKFVGAGYKSQYEKLFDALNNWPEGTYDEKEFKKKSKGKTFLKNLPDEKAYLRDLLLKTLRNYHSENNTEAQLNEMFLNIRLLIDKGLRNQAYDLIGKAQKLAEETELLSEQLMINDFLLTLYRMSPKDAEGSIVEMEEKEARILEQLKVTRTALHLRTRLIEIQINSQWEKRAAEVEELIEAVSAMQSMGNLTKRAELSLLSVMQLYWVRHHQYRECLDATLLWLGKIENNGNSFHYSADHYRVTLANLLLCALRLEQFDLFPDAIKKIKGIKTESEKEAAECFRVGAQYELIYILNSENFEHADSTLKYIEEGLKAHKRFLSTIQIVDYRFNIALMFFLRKKYAECLLQITELYHLSGRDERFSFTTTLARIMEWMCQASTNNFDVLDTMNRNIKRYLSDRNLKNELFDAITELFNGIIKEGRINPPSFKSIKKRINDVETAPQWEQLKGIMLAWL